MKPGERIGILGGTFNPIHIGHLILAQTALETHSLSRVLFIPSAQPPHKETTALLAADHRLSMVRTATEDNPFFDVSDTEVRRNGASYAIDTIMELHDAHPGADLFFIIGTDTLKELHSWKDIYTLLPLCTFVTFDRPGDSLPSIDPGDLRLDPHWAERLLKNTAGGRQIDISSTEIRYRVAEGLSICYLVPKVVELYIAEHGLYGSG